MPQAQITINAVVGSDDDLPINTLVQLDNNNIGGEVSYLWSILDQPAGAADVLSSATAQNPTFTPKKEGTYLVQLIVNKDLPTEDTDTAIAAVRQLKTRERVPAAGERTEDNPSRGWAEDTNVFLRTIDTHISDPGTVVGANATGGTLTNGDVVRATSSVTIKTGLPGQEDVPGFTKAPATTGTNLDELLLVVEQGVDGSDPVAAGALMVCRFLGKLDAITLGAGAVGDPIYVSDSATLSTTPGTETRQVGSIMAVSGADRDIWLSGHQVGQAPADRVYVVYGDPGSLVNAHRVDGLLASGVINNIPFTVRGGDVTTVPLVAKRFSAPATADLLQIHDETGTVLADFDSAGDLTVPNLTVTGSMPNLVIDGGLVVGFAGTPTADRVKIGDVDFFLDHASPGASSTPLINWSADNKLRFNRSLSTLETIIVNTIEMRVRFGGVEIPKGLVVGFEATPTADQVAVGDADLFLGIVSSNPVLLFDTSNDRLLYTRGSDLWQWQISGADVMTLGLNPVGGTDKRLTLPAVSRLLLTPRAVPTNTSAGELFNNTSTKKLQAVTAASPVARYVPQVFTQTVETPTSNHTVETVLGAAHTVKANSLTVGSTIRIRAWGDATAGAGSPPHTCTLRVRFGGTAGTQLAVVAVTITGVFNWDLCVDAVIYTTGNPGTGRANASVVAGLVGTANYVQNTNSFAPITTLDKTVVVTAQWSTGDPLNVTTIRGFILDIT